MVVSSSAVSLALALLVGCLRWVASGQSTAPVRVSTGEDLQAAIDNSTLNIVITEHLDLRGLQPSQSSSSNILLHLRGTTEYIQGDCQTEFEDGTDSFTAVLPELDPALVARKPGQCAIIADKTIFEIQLQGGVISMSNLYLRMHRRESTQQNQVRIVNFNGVSAWLTNMTVQGDAGQSQALYPFEDAQVYVQDSIIQNMNGTEGPIAEVRKNSSLVLDNCVLNGNTNLDPEPGAVAIKIEDFLASQPCAVQVLGGTLEGNAEPLFSVSQTSSGTCYIDDGAAEVWDEAEEETFPASTTEDAGNQATAKPFEAKLLTADARPADAPVEASADDSATEPTEGPDGDSDTDDPTPDADTVDPEGDDGGGDGGGFPVAGYAGIAVAVIAVALAALAFLVYRNKKKKKQQATAVEAADSKHGGKDVQVDQLHYAPGAAPTVPPNYHVGQPGQPSGALPPWGVPTPHHPPNAMWHGNYNMPYGGSHHGGSSSGGYGTVGNSQMTKGMTTTMAGTMSWDSYAAKGEKPIEQLEAALDALYDRKLPFFGRYNLFSAVERRVGGQGLVQFARIGTSTDMAAIKFYLQRAAFDSEKELYMDPQLCAMMPATLAIEDNTNGEWRTPYGFVFPPFVIIERGQSLDEWARDNNPDFITIFQALSHSVRALKELHKFGYAHRDIKPGNVLRRPTQHDWTLIDFGCAAQIGITAPLTLSLKYAAPETIAALEAGCRTIHVDAAVDIWAIGVIAFELLTGERVFPVVAAESQEACDERVKAGIAGRLPLPWEPKAEGCSERLAKMRGLKRTVLRCLARDPMARPSADQLLHSWDHTFDNMQTRGTDWSNTSGGSA